LSFDPADPVGSVFAEIIGKPAWQAKRGYAGMLTLEFGEPRLEVREPMPSTAESEPVRALLARRRVTIVGAWHLWVHSCDWRISEGGANLAHSESSDAEIDAAVALLDGQILKRVELDRERRSTWFCFDLDGVLETTPWHEAHSEEADQWLLFTPGDRVFSYRSDGKYSWGPGDQLPGEERWLQLRN
jgi:hypothetical protein